MQVTRPRFDPTINYGHILTAVTLALGLGTLIWNQAAFQAATALELDAVSKRAAVYIPRVDSLMQSQQVQDERIGNLSAAVGDIRKTNSEILSQMGGMREDLAGIKARLPTTVR